MQTVAIVVLSLLVLGLGAMLWLSQKKRLHQNSYIIFLLLNEEIRQPASANLFQFIRSRASSNPILIHSEVSSAVEKMADHLAEYGSTLATRTLIANAAQMTPQV